MKKNTSQVKKQATSTLIAKEMKKYKELEKSLRPFLKEPSEVINTYPHRSWTIASIKGM